MKLPFTFKHLQFEQYPNISEELVGLLHTYTDYHAINKKNSDGVTVVHLNHTPGPCPGSLGLWQTLTFVHVDPSSVLGLLPTLAEQFHKLHLGPIKRVGLIVTHPNTTQATHVDMGTQSLALNLPVLVDGPIAYTQLFKDTGKLTEVISADEVRPGVIEQRRYLQYDDPNPIELARYHLTGPTLLNIKLPHRVVNNSQSTRIALSFRFEVDPWHLT
jgi:hypothetical protein